MNDHVLTAIVLIPLLAAGLLAVIPRCSARMAHSIALMAMTATALLAWTLVARPPAAPDGLSHVVMLPWIPSLGADFALGLDGLSLPLVLLTATLSLLAGLAGVTIEKRARSYCALVLLLETGMLGVFLALDFVLFYVFWELILVPMYLLIALWGGSAGRAAARKFFLYTLAGGVLMLAAGLLLYGQSDLARLGAADLAKAGVLGANAAKAPSDAREAMRDWLASESPAAVRFTAAEASGGATRTFNLLALERLANRTDDFTATRWLGKSLAWWAFVLLLIGMAIKLPAVPLHTWLPDAHTEAPTPVSMLLAGVMLKMGGYALVRIAWPVCGEAAAELAWPIALVGVVSLAWGALAALAQDDFKRLVAYSSVSHMGYVLMGLAAGTLGADAWALGAGGAVFQMVAHGVTSAGLFFAVGVVYERVHHRDLEKLGGLMNRMPLASGLGLVLAMASLGLPGLCGFVGELLVLLATWSLDPWLAGSAAAVTVVTAAYTLRAIRLAYYGPEYRGPHGDRLTPITPRELAILAPLAAAAVLLGVRPATVTERVEPAIAACGAAFDSLNQPSVAAALSTDAAGAAGTTR